MDGARFDRLAKALARGSSRRMVLARLVGGAVAVAVAPRVAGVLAACGGRGSACAARGECCPGLGCVQGVCCTDRYDSCHANAECCTGFCYLTIPGRPERGGICEDPPGCKQFPDQPCASSAECCPGLECAALFADREPTCQEPGPGRPCAPYGHPCRTGLTCCGGICVDPRSDPIHCGGCGVACRPGPNEEPPICIGGQCLPGACLPGAHKCPAVHEPHGHFVCCTTSDCCCPGGCGGAFCPC